MSRVIRWHYGTACPRWVLRQGVCQNLPPTITLAALNALSDGDDDYYEECEGTVTVKGYHDPGSMYGGRDNLGSPPEGDNEASACSLCDTDDWTDAELDAFADTGRDQ